MSDQQNDKPKKVATPEEKAAAAAAAKAAAEARRKASADTTLATQVQQKDAEQVKEIKVPMESTGDSSASTAEVASTEKRKPTPEEKAAAAAAAREAAEARRKAKEAGETASKEASETASDTAPKEKRQFTPEEKAAASANAGGDTADSAEEAALKEPSKNQPVLDEMVKAITTKFGSDVIEDSYINMNSKEDPTLIIKNVNWFEVAAFLKEDPELAFAYLSNLTGVDYEEHMEVVYYLHSFSKGYSVMVKVKADREQATIASVTPIWAGANWNEREVYDLLGINFPGHPNHVRIMMTDDWVGHPLRKDYEPFDKEV